MTDTGSETCGLGAYLSLLDSFFSVYLDSDINSVRSGEAIVCASMRRDRPELHYANEFPFWCVVTRNRCVISVQAALHDHVSRLANQQPAGWFRTDEAMRRLAALANSTFGPGTGLASGPVLFCSRETYRGSRPQHCRAVNDTDRPALSAAELLNSSLNESIADETCFAGFDGDQPVALCGVYPIPHMSDRIADISMNCTLEPFRRRGFGHSVLSAVTKVVLDRDRLPIYITSDRNVASQMTAASVGYVQYGWQCRAMPPVWD